MNYVENVLGKFKLRHSIRGGVHCVPKILKSKRRGASPRFTWHLKEGHIVISKNKIFFKSVEGNF